MFLSHYGKYKSEEEGIDFDVLIFNEQKGITVNYANGKSKGKGQKSTTAKKSTTKPTLKQVWITATGKKYHRISKCGNMKCSKKLSLTEAKRLHLTSCKKCYKWLQTTRPAKTGLSFLLIYSQISQSPPSLLWSGYSFLQTYILQSIWSVY